MTFSVVDDLHGRYRCTRQPCPVAHEFGDILIGLPGRAYTCECGAPMTATTPENPVTDLSTLPAPPPPVAPAPAKPPLRLPQLSDHSVRVTAGIVVALGTYLVVVSAANPISAVIALSAAGVAAWAVIGNPGKQISRTLALALAVHSHGPAAGVGFDRCFPARAKHFRRFIRTGANPKLPVREARWCEWCGAPESCNDADPDDPTRAHTYKAPTKELSPT
jgi:hypothetical protein